MFAFVNNNSSKAALDSKGTDFWLMFNGNVSAPTITLFITSNINTSGNLSNPGLAISCYS